MIYGEERIKYDSEDYKRINNQNLKTEKRTQNKVQVFKCKFSANEIFIWAYATDFQIHRSRGQEKGKGERYKDFKFYRIKIFEMMGEDININWR